MPELNKANRQVCDVDIRILKTMEPFLNFDTANTTTAGLSGDSVYAMAKGSRRIAFANPIEGTMTIEAQVYPFKFFSLLSNGVIESNAVYAAKSTITCATGGELDLNITNGTVVDGSMFAYPKGMYGDEDSIVKGTFADGKFTAETPEELEAETEYEVGYMVSRDSGVQRISFNNKNLPKDYFITMSTLDKDEEGAMTPFLMTAYKASIQRTFELSFSSEGDPASVTLTFDLLEDKNGNVLDFVEITEELVIDDGGSGGGGKVTDEVKVIDQNTQIPGMNKQASELISADTAIGDDGSVTGTLSYIENWEEFSSDPAEQNGNFMPVHLDEQYSGKTIKVTGKTVKEAQDLDWVLRVADNNSTFKFEVVDAVGIAAMPIAAATTTLFTLNFKKATLKKSDVPESEMTISVEKLANANVPKDANEVASKANQDAITVGNSGNDYTVSGKLADMQAFTSTDPLQSGEHKWIGLIINTGEDDITKVTVDGSSLTEEDVADADSVNAPKGSLILWLRAEEVVSAPRSLKFKTDGKKETTVKITFEDTTNPLDALTVNPESQDKQCWDKNVKDLQSNVTIVEDNISGMLHYTEGFNKAYPNDESKQKGYYLILDCKSDQDATVKFKMEGGGASGTEKTMKAGGDQMICYVKSNQQKLKFTVTKGQKTATRTFDFTGVTLNPMRILGDDETIGQGELSYGSKTAKDLYTNLGCEWTDVNCKVKGEFTKITEWSELPVQPVEGGNHYFAFKFDPSIKDKKFVWYKEQEKGGETDTAGDDELFWVLNIDDTKHFTFNIDDSDVLKLDFSEATLN